MSKTWLLRGVAVAVFAVLVGSWGVGLVDLGDTPASSEKPANTTPVPPPDSDPASHGQPSTVLDKAARRRTREAGTSEAVLTEPSPVSTDEATDDAPGTPSPTSTAPSPDPSSPSDPSEPPPGSSTPPSTPSNPPNEPTDECTDLASVVDCALDPITGRP